jgi:AcrR family transcriptional regulator
MLEGSRIGGAGGGPAPDRAVLDAASLLLAEHGFEGLVPAGGLSEWELFAALMREDESRFNQMVASLLAREDSAAGRLTAVIEACVVEYDWTMWIELWSLALRDERARTLRRELDRDFRNTIGELIADGVRAGEFEVEDRDAATMAIATLIDSLAVQATLRDTTVSPNYMFRACASVAGQLLGAELTLRGRDGDRNA